MIVELIRRITEQFHVDRAFVSLMKSQWLKPVRLKKLSERKLRALIKHSYENVPYYRRIFKEQGITSSDIKSIEDFQKLPVLTKKIIRENFYELIASNFLRSALIPSSTSGSTGEPFKFMLDRLSLTWLYAAVLRSFYWAGFKRFDKMVNVWGFPEKERPSRKPWQRQITISTFGADEKKMQAYLEVIKKFKPRGMRGYASSIYLLARLAEDVKLRFVISSSEMLWEHYRKLIERRFGCSVYDNYSSREFMIASECEEHRGYHIACENLIVEVVRNDEHVSAGEIGKILITDLTRYGMPFIRYEIGDIGVPSDEVCPCGRGLPLIKSIEGRTTDMVFTPDGKFVSGPAVTLIFKDLDIEWFQVVQKTKQELIVKIVRGAQYRDDVDTQFILNRLKQYIGDMKVGVKFVDDVPPARSGKRRVVVSEVDSLDRRNVL